MLTSIVAIAAAIVAGIGLTTWKRQARWKANQAIAAGVLKHLLHLRSLLEGRTHAAITCKTTPSAATDGGAIPTAFREYLDQIRVTYYSLRIACLDAEARWGSRVATAQAPLQSCLEQFAHAIADASVRPEAFTEELTEQYIRGCRIIYGQRGEEAEAFDARLVQSFDSIENEIRQHMQ